MVNPHKKFCASLTTDERMLIALRDELYSGSWDQMLKDLQERLKGRPYIFKLATRIEEDIARIQKLRDYEKKNNLNLAEQLKGEANEEKTRR
jgi:hypothetical protein